MRSTPHLAGSAGPVLRAALRLALALAVLVVLAGATVAVRGYHTSRAGPADIVRDYFTALARGDSAAALAYGDVPAGPRGLLSPQALRNQLRVAPITDIAVSPTNRVGRTAVIAVGYRLGFRDRPRTAAAEVPLHRTDGVWRLDQSALVTRFTFGQARQRATIGSASVPVGRTLVFPGAVPLRFDSPYLSGRAGYGSLTFGADVSTPVTVRLTAAGRSAMQVSVLAALRRCLRVGGDVGCPQPDERYVPGSLRGQVLGRLIRPSVVLVAGQVGVLRLDATASARVSFERLGFRNVVRSGTGTCTLNVHALAAARSPLTVRWSQ